MKFENIAPGMVLYTTTRRKMGNTTMRTTEVVTVRIVEVDVVGRRALVKWGGLEPRWWPARKVVCLRVKRPELVDSVTGSQRLKRRGE